MSQLYYVTTSTTSNPILDLLKKTVEEKNENIIVFGLDLNRPIGWQSKGKVKGNFGLKLQYFYDFISDKERKDDDIVLCCDAFDVLYIGNKEEVLKRYLAFNMPIVFGSETNCHPDKAKEKEYKDRKQKFPFLNSGLFIGRIWAFRELFKNYVFNDSESDQRFYTNHFLTRPDLIALDYKNSLFLNCYSLNKKDITLESKNLVRYGDATPQFLHCNGNAKDTLLPNFVKIFKNFQ